MKKQHVQLSETDRAYLEALISKGNLKAKAYRRALGLLELDRGKTYTVLGVQSKSMEGNGQRLQLWPAVHHRKDMLSGVYGY